MPLDPKFFTMGAKIWRHPENEKLWLERLESEKKKAVEAKKKAVEAAFTKEVEFERDKMTSAKLAEAGRLLSEDKQDEYIAKLKADVARLEAKRVGTPPEKSSQEKIADHDQERANQEAEERGKETDKEVKLTAEAMLAAQEKELAEKKKQHEKELAELAEKRRRELLEYKHFLGLNAKAEPPRRPRRFADRPPALHEDPEFWKLGSEDQHMLEMMSPERRAEYGFGPYEEDDVEYDPELHKRFEDLGIGTTKLKEFGAGFIDEGRLEEKMRRFLLRGPGQHPAGFDVVREFEPLALSAPLGDLPPLETLSAEDRKVFEQMIHEQRKFLREDMVKEAIVGQGANGLLEFRIEGPHSVQEGELAGQYELIADGIPVRLAPSSSLQRPRPTHRPPPQQHDTGWGAHHGHGPMPLGGFDNNGGAGFEDPPAFGEDLWGAQGGGGGGGWNPFGETGPHAGGGGGGAAAGWGGWGDEGGMAAGWGAGGQPQQAQQAGWGAGGQPQQTQQGWEGWEAKAPTGGGDGWNGGGGKSGWQGWGGNPGQAGWGGTTGQAGWGGGGARGGDGAVWGGGTVGGKTWEPKWEEKGPKVPQGMRDLPWGAQAYIKSMRARQEREMREAAEAAARGMPVRPPPAPAPAKPPSRTPLEDPALFGNSFARPSDPRSPSQQQRSTAGLAATPRPSQLGGAGGWGGGATGSEVLGRLKAQREAQKTTTDPDDGQGAAAGGGGWGPGQQPW